MKATTLDIRPIGKVASLAVLSLMLAAGTAHAAGSHSGGHGHGPDIGSPAKAAEAERTIRVTMKDSYYEPSTVTVRKGETVRFKIENAGQLVHEFGLGTAEMHKAHQQEMAKMMEAGALTADSIDREAMRHGEMAHDDPNSVLLEPGEQAEITWTFDTDTRLEFACNVPGHYEAGMIGMLRIRHTEGS